MLHKRIFFCASFLASLLSTSCIPFTVGSTARPVLPGEHTQSSSFYVVPNSFDVDSAHSLSRMGADTEVRYGLDDRSDIGLRVVGYSGGVMSYKRRLNGATTQPGFALAAQGGVGIVNMGEHAHFEASLLASGPDNAVTPYGGIRAMKVYPISRGAVHDSPTIGAFFGVKFGDDYAISPEIGFFHDRSALGIRTGSLIIVPSITISRTGNRHGPY
jgi:hypothetical protein